MTTAIVIISIVAILAMGLCLIASINLCMNTISSIKNSQSINNKDTEEFQKVFNSGYQSALRLVTLSLFKMYQEDQILDFESIHENLIEVSNKISTDAEELKKLNDEFIKFSEDDLDV